VQPPAWTMIFLGFIFFMRRQAVPHQVLFDSFYTDSLLPLRDVFSGFSSGADLSDPNPFLPFFFWPRRSPSSFLLISLAERSPGLVLGVSFLLLLQAPEGTAMTGFLQTVQKSFRFSLSA